MTRTIILLCLLLSLSACTPNTGRDASKTVSPDEGADNHVSGVSGDTGHDMGTSGIPAEIPPPPVPADIIFVKFTTGTDLTAPDSLIPPDLNESVAGIARIVPPSENESEEFAGSDILMWYQLALIPGTNVDDFTERLEALDVVEKTQYIPSPSPPTASYQ